MIHTINGCPRENNSYIEIPSTNQVLARCHVVGVSQAGAQPLAVGLMGDIPYPLGLRPPRDNALNHVTSSRAYLRDAPIGPRHSAVLLCIERLTMAELTDQELNDHMDDYEQVSI